MYKYLHQYFYNANKKWEFNVPYILLKFLSIYVRKRSSWYKAYKP